MADVVYIDAEDGKKRVMNNAALYTRLLAKFRAEAAFGPIAAAVDAGNYEEARGLSHTMKGLAANLSLRELHLRLLALEAELKAESPGPEAAAALAAAAADAFACTMARIDKAVAENAG